MPIYNPPAAVGGYTEGARAYKAAAQNILNNNWTPIVLDNERYDTDTIHDNIAFNTHLTCRTAGKYIITGCFMIAAHATGQRTAAIRLNGVTYIAENRQVGLAAVLLAITVAAIYDLAITDYVELVVYQNSGVALNVLAISNYSPEFAMQRIG